MTLDASGEYPEKSGSYHYGSNDRLEILGAPNTLVGVNAQHLKKNAVLAKTTSVSGVIVDPETVNIIDLPSPLDPCAYPTKTFVDESATSP